MKKRGREGRMEGEVEKEREGEKNGEVDIHRCMKRREPDRSMGERKCRRMMIRIQQQ